MEIKYLKSVQEKHITKNKKIELCLSVHDALKKINKKYKFWNSNLCGSCAVGCFALKELFLRNNIMAHVYFGLYAGYFNHCWVQDNLYIYDPTASQFGWKNIFFCKKNSKIYNGIKIHKPSCLRELPISQYPDSNKIGLILKEVV